MTKIIEAYRQPYRSFANTDCFYLGIKEKESNEEKKKVKLNLTMIRNEWKLR